MIALGLTGLCATGLAVLAGRGTAPADPPGLLRPASPAARRIDWGLYYLRWGHGYADALRGELSQFASPPAYVMYFLDLRIPFQTQRAEAVAGVGAVPLITIELVTWHGYRRKSYLPAINRGEYDAFLRQWALDAKAYGRRVLLRFGYEFNGNWFSWAGDPQGFVAAWRRAYDIFKKAGATNVEWVWSPNVVSCPDTPENSMHRYWPGNAYVDWVGIDGYNFGEHHDQWHHWESFEQVFGQVLADVSRRYADARIMVSEFGCAPGDQPGQRARWIRDAYEYLRSVPRVDAAIWFNLDKQREGEPNWRLTDSDQSLHAFNETFACERGARKREEGSP